MALPFGFDLRLYSLLNTVYLRSSCHVPVVGCCSQSKSQSTKKDFMTHFLLCFSRKHGGVPTFPSLVSLCEDAETHTWNVEGDIWYRDRLSLPRYFYLARIDRGSFFQYGTSQAAEGPYHILIRRGK
eukprot:scaffold202983_cov82-Cyclotella_meneghiniana.AAC.1